MSIRRAVKKVLSPWFRLTASRKKGLAAEIRFWDKWFRTKGWDWPDGYLHRVNPESIIDGRHRAAVDTIDEQVVDILDVGSGPLSGIGKKHPAKTLRITGVDPLADEFKILLKKYSITPAIRLLRCEGEELSSFFGAEKFHYVNGENSIDHSRDPVQCIIEMIKVTRGGGLVTLYHRRNEAKYESWRGLHQWNFDVTDDMVLQISGRTGSKRTLTRQFLGQEIVNALDDDNCILSTIRVHK